MHFALMCHQMVQVIVIILYRLEKVWRARGGSITGTHQHMLLLKRPVH
jgi:hypothetical protein